MSIITISSGSFSKGREIAEKLGEELGYECLAREVISETSECFGIPELKLSRAFHDSPSLINRFTNERERYLSNIKYSLLQHVQKDNIVYHGLAGHLFLRGVLHALNVKIVSNMKDRIAEMMKNKDISKQKARQFLEKDDKKREKWNLRQLGEKTSDLIHYDLVLHLDKFTVDDAVSIIAELSKRPCFQKTAHFHETFNDLLKAAKVQSTLMEKFPKIDVVSKRGRVRINYRGVFGQEEYMKKQIMDFLYSKPEYRSTVFDVSSVLDLK